MRDETLDAIKQALQRMGVDLTQNSRTGLHAAGTSYGWPGAEPQRLSAANRHVVATATAASTNASAPAT